jgi:ubiquinone/menaquinone biosynthesis C-methylase UbiE
VHGLRPGRGVVAESIVDDSCAWGPAVNWYERVSEQPLYAELNRRLVECVSNLSGKTVIDLGCGTGSISELVLQSSPDADVWAIDPDADMCAAVRRRLGDQVRVIQGDASTIRAEFEAGSVHAVLAANCVHLFPDIRAAFADAASVLPAGGVLAFNSAFHDSAARQDERQFYWELVLRAGRIAKKMAARDTSDGDAGRRRGARPLAKRTLNVDAYRSDLESVGLTSVTTEEVEVLVDEPVLRDIVSAQMFASGTLPGVEPEIAIAALAGALDALAANGEAAIHRRWIFMTARRP